MKRYLSIPIATILFTGCGASDYHALLNASLSKNPSSALKVFAKNKSIRYAQNPQQLSNDLKSIDKHVFKALLSLIEGATGSWGKENVKIPKKKEYVKYMQNFKSRALVDFDKGFITVETLDETNSKESLKNAIITTLLLPDDPRSADLFGVKEIKFGDTPYLLGEVKDDQGKDIRYEWRANRYAEVLLKNNYQTKNIVKGNKEITVHYVTMPMVKDHSDIRVAKFKPYVKEYAKKFNVSENLIYAIMQTESNFNQYAVSNAGAFGLMQIVPTSAGKDAYKFAKGKNTTPSKSYLFNAKNNIELGAAYIHILGNRYLPDIKDPVSKEYCVISAYNTGSGNVLRTFHKNREKAQKKINALSASAIYKKLRSDLPYEETRRYLKKVVDYKKAFVSL